jgi:glycosyltransferase involved in cell wall biosynthesis
MAIDFTVAIPTYNGESRLPKVLEYLQNQQYVENLHWEIIVVDNNSTDGTARLIENYQSNWPENIPLRYYFEPKQGAGFARNKAIAEAESELVGFLDDDNLPSSTWVISAYKFGQEHPQAGAYASQIHGLFAVPPPENLKPILFYLAITERGPEPLQYEPRKKGFPPSAGLVVRRHIWSKYVPQHLLFEGRVGASMVGSEDAEALVYIHQGGWEIWYNPEMVVEHVIPPWRLEETYLLSLMRGIGLSRCHLRMLLIPSWQRPFALILYLLNDCRKLILQYLRYWKNTEKDIIARCELERLAFTFISPVYLFCLRINRLLARNL